MRVFVSVDLPLPGLGGGFGRPEAPPHLTLAFLGEVEETRVPALVETVRSAVAGVAPFHLVAKGVGAFPSRARPRIVWVGTVDGSERLVQVANRIRDGLTASGFAFDSKPFVPHVTVLRVRRPADRTLAESLLAHPPADPLGERTVAEVDVKASSLGSEGATHRLLARIPLPGSATP